MDCRPRYLLLTMTKQKFDILLSAFFSDNERINKLIVFRDDLEIEFEISNFRLLSSNRIFRFSVLDILQMNLDTWHSIKVKELLNVNSAINPSALYQDTQHCMDSILSRFPDICYNGVEYEKYISLILSFEDIEWYDEEELARYEAEGYRRIDLELINYGYRRNVEKVIELLDQGANPMIDPDDNISESVILELLSSKEGLHFNNIVSLHEQKLTKGYESFRRHEAADLITELYTTASSAKVYDTINEYQNVR